MPHPGSGRVDQVDILTFTHSPEVLIALRVAFRLFSTGFNYPILDALDSFLNKVTNCSELYSFNVQKILHMCRTHAPNADKSNSHQVNDRRPESNHRFGVVTGVDIGSERCSHHGCTQTSRAHLHKI